MMCKRDIKLEIGSKKDGTINRRAHQI